jgi:hypothetical protein
MYRDVIEAAKAVSKAKNRNHKKRFAAKEKKQLLFPLPRKSKRQGTHTGDLYVDDFVSAELSYKFVAGYDYSVISSGENYDLLDQLGFQPKFAVPTIWALLPWSWLADYFATTGGWLDDVFLLDPRPLIYYNEIKRVEVEYKSFPRFELEGASSGYNPAYFVYEDKTPEMGSAYKYNRIVHPTLLRRAFRFKTADEIAKGWFTKSLNLAAIIAKKHK